MKLPKIKENPNFPLIHLRPMLFAALGFVLGILSVFQYLIHGKSLPFFILLGLCLFLLGCAICLRRAVRAKILYFCVGLVILFSVCGGFAAYMQLAAYEHTEIEENAYYTVYGTISEVGEFYDGRRLLLSDVTLRSETETFSSDYGLTLIVYGFEAEFKEGTRVKTYVRVQTQEKNEYFSYHMANGYKFVAFTGEKSVSAVGKTRNLFEKIRLKGKSVLEKYLYGDALSVANGMLFGDTSEMDEGTLTQFRELGIAHVFAVSGLHIGFVCMMILFFLRKTEVRNPLRFILPTIAVFFYAGICDFSPSSLRAAIMCSAALLFEVLGAPYDKFSGVLFSAIIVLALNPADITSYGFLLSYTCVLSILILSPVLERAFQRLPQKIGNSLAVCLSIQIGIFPLQMLLFGYAAPISILLNLVFIPLLTPLYSILLLFLIVTGFIPELSFVFTALQWIWDWIVYLLSEIPLIFTVKNLSVSRGLPIFYLGIICASYHVNLRKSVKIAASSTCFAVFLITLFI